MKQTISGERKTTYYVGTALTIIGAISFFSALVTDAMHFGDFTNFVANAKSSAWRAVVGMGLMILGGIVQSIGARGLAGSGVVLDPSQARSDLEPYSRMAGGMVKDALDEAQIRVGSPPERVVMIKCAACGKLNEDDSKFCQECGKPI
jgi:hypothetical protein